VGPGRRDDNGGGTVELVCRGGVELPEEGRKNLVEISKLTRAVPLLLTVHRVSKECS
jgi:hypothetical protein